MLQELNQGCSSYRAHYTYPFSTHVKKNTTTAITTNTLSGPAPTHTGVFSDYHLSVIVFPDSCCGGDRRLRDRQADTQIDRPKDRPAGWIAPGPAQLWLIERKSSVSPSVIFSLSAVSESIHRNINTLLGEENHWATFHYVLTVISAYAKSKWKQNNLALGSEIMEAHIQTQWNRAVIKN